MTTSLLPPSAQVRHGGATVRWVFRERDNLRVREASECFERVLTATAAAFISHQADGLDAEQEDSLLLSSQVYEATRDADFLAHETYLERLSYNSPLEITFVIGVAGGSAIAIANKLLALHDRWVQSRVVAARGSRDVALLNTQTEAILRFQSELESGPQGHADAVMALSEVERMEREISATFELTEAIEVIEHSQE